MNSHPVRYRLASLAVACGALAAATALAQAPSVISNPVTGLTGTTVTLNGTANPNGSSTQGWFFLTSLLGNLQLGGGCSDVFLGAPAGAQALGAGSSGVAYSEAVTGLSPGLRYYWCAKAKNGAGTANGNVQTFYTPLPPQANTSAPLNVTQTAATLRGVVHPYGGATTAWFRYSTVNPGVCNDSFGTRAPAAGGVAIAATTPDTVPMGESYGVAISGLAPLTTYYYCAVASNGEGLDGGAVLSFATPATVDTVTLPATSVTSTSATLVGQVNPNGTAKGFFRYSTDNPGVCDSGFGIRAPSVDFDDQYFTGTSNVVYTRTVTGLAPGTTYYYCAITDRFSVGGTRTYGTILSFTTPSTAPTTTTNAASAVTIDSATLNGHAVPNGEAAFGYLRWGTSDPGTCSDAYGTRVPGLDLADEPLGAATGVDYSRPITGLAPGTTYYYCAAARNSLGTSFGAVTSFATPPLAPLAVTTAATGIGTTGATLNGSANPGSGATTAWFRYATSSPGACNDSFGTRAPAAGVDAGAGTSAVPFSQAITGLAPGTTYHYCAIAQNSAGTAFGAVMTFATTPVFTLNATLAGAGSGTVTAAGISCPGDCSESVASGTLVTLTASPSVGSVFAGWSGCDSATGAQCTVTVTANRTATATFAIATYTVTPSAGANGTISPSTAQAVNHGGTATFTVTPAAGYSAAVGGTCGGNLSGSTYTTSAIVANCTVAATFTLVPAPSLSLDTTSLDFGGQSMGTTSTPKTIKVTNIGNAPVTVSSVSSSNAQYAQSNNCATLAPAAFCIVTVMFSPVAAAGPLNTNVPVTGTLSIASNAAGSPHAVALAGTAQKSLVTHYYATILGRAPDSGGAAFWANEATRVAGLGANVNEVWFALAAAFYFSPEYLALNRNPTQFVTDLYRTFFNRAPDAGGLAFWTGLMGQGMPREVVLVSYMFSTEFVTFTQATFGSTAARAEVDAVVDFYRGLLSRLPDDGGFNHWVGKFRNAQCSGPAAVAAEVEAISSAFALSSEYAARARSNEQYVGDLYNAFLRRGGDLAGVQFWIGQVASGAQTREQVRVAFRNSAEFQARVAAIVAQGCQS